MTGQDRTGRGGRRGGVFIAVFCMGMEGGHRRPLFRADRPVEASHPPPPVQLLPMLCFGSYGGRKEQRGAGGRRGGSAAASFKRRLKGSPGASATP